MRLKRRRKNAGSSYPTCQPISSTGADVRSSLRLASSILSRAIGVRPVTFVKRRLNVLLARLERLVVSSTGLATEK